MARPQKEGLDYFPVDVNMDQDDKLTVVIGEFGMQGLGIILKLLAEIYKNSYFYRWSKRERITFSSRINVDNNVVNDVVNGCVEWGFFNQKLFDEHSILTSKGIQKRYIEAAKRRKEVILVDDYVLIDPKKASESENVNITVVNADGNAVNVYIKPNKRDLTYTETPQSKVNESKVNEIKEININDDNRMTGVNSSEYKEEKTIQEPYESFYAAHKRIFGYVCNQTQQQSLIMFIDKDGMEEAVIVRALERAVLHKTQYSFKFITGIITNYLDSGAKTLAEAIALDDEFERGKMLKEAKKQKLGVRGGYDNRNQRKPNMPVVSDSGQQRKTITKEEFRESRNRALDMDGKPAMTEKELELAWAQYQIKNMKE